MGRNTYYLTGEGLKKAEAKLDELEEKRLEKIKNRHPRALDYREVDSEYISYQEELGQIEKKIHDLRRILESYEVIQAPPKKKRDKILLGATVVVEMGGSVEKFTIVGTFESDPARQKISNISPLGKALLGRKAGEEIEVKAGMVNNNCKIIKVKYEDI